MKFIFLFCLLVGVVGCVTPARMRMPGNRFHVPEVSAKRWAGEAGISYYGSADLKIVDNITEATPQTTPDFSEIEGFGIEASLGLGSVVDVYLFSGQDFPYAIGVKYQAFGGNSNGTKLTASAGYILGEYENQDEIEETNISGTARNDYTGYEVGLSLGHRFNDSALVYLAPFYMELSGQTKVERDNAGSVSITANPEGEGSMYGVGLGAMLSAGNSRPTAFIVLEASAARSHWKRTSTTVASDDFEEVYLGVKVGGRW